MAGPVGGLCGVQCAPSHHSSAPSRSFKRALMWLPRSAHGQLLFPGDVALQEAHRPCGLQGDH